MPSMISSSRAWVMPNGSIAGASARGGRIARLVHRVVHFAAEGVEGGDRAPAFGRQEEKRVIKARSALRGFVLAVFVGSHCITSARASISGQSQGRNTGRRRKTFPRARSSFSRILRPP